MISRVRSFIEAPDAAPLALALELFRFQFEHNAPYRRYCERAGKNSHNVAGWNDIPAVITSAFKEADWSVLSPSERAAVFLSSGTTARDRSRHAHSAATLALYEASLVRWFKVFVLPGVDRAQFRMLTPPPISAPNSSLAHMFETVSSVFGIGSYHATVQSGGAWHLDCESLAADLEVCAAGSAPAVLCGTAFSFVHFCDWARATGARLRLPAGSRAIETGGYKGRSRVVPKDELHAMIVEFCGIKSERIVSEYGMSELSSQAYDRVCGSSEPRLFRFPPWAPFQIISPETGREVSEGEAGLIRVFDLANVGSVMAVQTEDLGVRRGAGFELLGRAALAEPRGCSWMPAP